MSECRVINPCRSSTPEAPTLLKPISGCICSLLVPADPRLSSRLYHLQVDPTTTRWLRKCAFIIRPAIPELLAAGRGGALVQPCSFHVNISITDRGVLLHPLLIRNLHGESGLRVQVQI
jgi:hypothetical protein